MKNTRKLLTIPAALSLLTLAALGCGGNPAPKEAPETTTTTDLHTDAGADRCARHDLPAADCFICDPALRDPGRLWCAGHDRYEDRCFLCHPELEDPDRLWCSEHSLYEDECFLCHPELRDVTTAKAPVTAGDSTAESTICWRASAASATPSWRHLWNRDRASRSASSRPDQRPGQASRLLDRSLRADHPTPRS